MFYLGSSCIAVLFSVVKNGVIAPNIKIINYSQHFNLNVSMRMYLVTYLSTSGSTNLNVLMRMYLVTYLSTSESTCTCT